VNEKKKHSHAKVEEWTSRKEDEGKIQRRQRCDMMNKKYSLGADK
jgi:hypothetical protein